MRYNTLFALQNVDMFSVMLADRGGLYPFCHLGGPSMSANISCLLRSRWPVYISAACFFAVVLTIHDE